jgi:CubicO group peptidase (beta-lactamase class C family)
MRRSPLFLVLAAAALTPGALTAQPAARTVRVDAGRLAGLESFVDGVLAQQIATREVAGAVVMVVHDGRVLFTRGYGHADIERGLAVDAQRTLFRPGSVSKLFTWVALMQQVERGRVDLDADVNTYLDFRIPELGGQPIRIRDLLSHTPGMSDVSGISVDSESKLVPYGQWLKDHIPSRQWPAGTEISYSNYGASLAGYIVERVSGEPFADYTERHIFAPLGMRSTTFREPLPAQFRPQMATGYRFADGKFEARPYELFSNIMPAGSAAATAPDMARFIQAMLGGGRLGNARILTPASVATLWRNSFANAPGLPGMAHGFMVAREAGPRMVGHGGNTGDFHSYLLLVPGAKLGFYVSYTGGQGSYGARTELSDAIVGRLFPQAPAPRYAGSEPSPPLGTYRMNRRDYSRDPNPRGDYRVSAGGPNRIIVEVDGRKTAWERIGPRSYELITGARAGGPYDRIAFYGSAEDRKMSFATLPHVAFHLVKP